MVCPGDRSLNVKVPLVSVVWLGSDGLSHTPSSFRSRRPCVRRGRLRPCPASRCRPRPPRRGPRAGRGLDRPQQSHVVQSGVLVNNGHEFGRQLEGRDVGQQAVHVPAVRVHTARRAGRSTSASVTRRVPRKSAAQVRRCRRDRTGESSDRETMKRRVRRGRNAGRHSGGGTSA